MYSCYSLNLFIYMDALFGLSEFQFDWLLAIANQAHNSNSLLHLDPEIILLAY